MTAELLDEVADDPETAVISWLTPLYPAGGHVAVTRRSGDPLPFYIVNSIIITEDIDCACSDARVSVHVLTHKAAGEVASRDEATKMHRRMLLLARYLEDVDLANGRKASIDYVKDPEAPVRVEYGDENILRRTGRYTVGFSYAEVQ